MILAEGVCKRLGNAEVLRDVSFAVQAGEVVGLVGPNGAGKTTTLRILAGFLEADRGRVAIAGHDMARDPAAAVASLGYLVEQTPLYAEMRVDEYLRFRARLKGVPRRQIGQRVAAAADEVGLAGQGRRLMATLSKGYRQRVGLADALVATPPLLLLDEPTEGLDPVQMRAFRLLLRRLSPRYTVLLSSHLLAQVEVVCDRVIVLLRGRVAAQGTLADLRASLALAADASLEAVFLALADRSGAVMPESTPRQPKGPGTRAP